MQGGPNGSVKVCIEMGSIYRIDTNNQGLLGLPNSREHETEADRIGVELAARAGYDPRAAITLWEKMGQVGGNEPPKFMSTHPPRADRVKDLTRYSQKVLPLYEQAKARG
jgi:predicted Zn-dependent protease